MCISKMYLEKPLFFDLMYMMTIRSHVTSHLVLLQYYRG